MGAVAVFVVMPTAGLKWGPTGTRRYLKSNIFVLTVLIISLKLSKNLQSTIAKMHSISY